MPGHELVPEVVCTSIRTEKLLLVTWNTEPMSALLLLAGVPPVATIDALPDRSVSFIWVATLKVPPPTDNALKMVVAVGFEFPRYVMTAPEPLECR